MARTAQERLDELDFRIAVRNHEQVIVDAVRELKHGEETELELPSRNRSDTTYYVKLSRRQ